MDRCQVRAVIVDDNHSFVRAAREVVNGIPWIDLIGTISSAEEALEFLRDVQPDLILMDIKLPRMDGIQATRTIRSQYPEIRVVVLTLMNSPEYKQAALEAGAHGFLTKSEVGHKLSSVIETIFQEERSEPCLPKP